MPAQCLAAKANHHGVEEAATVVSWENPVTEEHYLALRRDVVRSYFPDALAVDDYLSRVEVELSRHGFTADSSIAVLNLCRDEICNSLKSKVELVFGAPFNMHGLGAVLTCGVTGMGAGLSHCPQGGAGCREKYIFFSFPHIAVDAAGQLGEVSRASCPHSHACGALLKLLGEIKAAGGGSVKLGLEEVHDAEDPEYSILKHRLEQHLATCGIASNELDLDTLTLLAEEAITKDLEALIAASVDTNKADYAVITGVQVHNWAVNYTDAEPNLEFVEPRSAYVVVNGKKKTIDITSSSALTPRMLQSVMTDDRDGTFSGSTLRALGDVTYGGGIDQKSKEYVMGRKAVEAMYREFVCPPVGSAEEQYLAVRESIVRRYFPDAFGVDDFMARVEMELYRHGFSTDNSIACLNLCRDEICNSMKSKVQSLYGAPFNVHGLGAVLTCGVTGMGAGLSHCPRTGGRQKYVFFSFPHIAVNAAGVVGEVSRPGCPHSHACGALLKVLGELKKAGTASKVWKIGADEDVEEEVHDIRDPEYSILKHRLERYIAKCGVPYSQISLDTLTVLAEEAITQDLEEMIAATVDTSTADYSVITGIQVHNWAVDYTDEEPNLEWVEPRSAYVVVNGQRAELDLHTAAALTPRMFQSLLRDAKGAVDSKLPPSELSSFVPSAGSDPRSKDNTLARREARDKFKGFADSTDERSLAMQNYFALREKVLHRQFPDALPLDDFMGRLEMELCKYGFRADNSIAVLNLCRDEICNSIKAKVQSVFGAPFNIHGLGGVLTCGVTGMGAGLSHCPTGGRDKYVFFSFPHVAVDAAGTVGKVSRAACPESHACGALLKVLSELNDEGDKDFNSHRPEEFHDVRDPEYSILKHRLKRYINACGISYEHVSLRTLTVLAEEAITQDLEDLIAASVDTSKADYAVITGIQVHNWGLEYESEEPNLEWVDPRCVYVVVDGNRMDLDLHAATALTPRIVRGLLDGRRGGDTQAHGQLERISTGWEDGGPRSKESLIAKKEMEDMYCKFTHQEDSQAMRSYFKLRESILHRYFPASIGVDDFMARVEVALCKFGFTANNSIAVLNLCRDEICNPLKHKVGAVFGAPFNIHGLGGVLTCGVTGMGAGLSHCPAGRKGSREKYIFFSFPHIAVDAAGEVGEISRASRPHSHACGALLKVLGELKREADGLSSGCTDALDTRDPEYSILKQRLERHVAASGLAYADLTLDSLTGLAEQAITQDLEALIAASVDTSKADYAVITGIQIHNWAVEYDSEEPNLEWVEPRCVYVVVDGQKQALDLSQVSALTPRMLKSLLGSSREAAANASLHHSCRPSHVAPPAAVPGTEKSDAVTVKWSSFVAARTEKAAAATRGWASLVAGKEQKRVAATQSWSKLVSGKAEDRLAAVAEEVAATNGSPDALNGESNGVSNPVSNAEESCSLVSDCAREMATEEGGSDAVANGGKPVQQAPVPPASPEGEGIVNDKSEALAVSVRSCPEETANLDDDMDVEVSIDEVVAGPGSPEKIVSEREEWNSHRISIGSWCGTATPDRRSVDRRSIGMRCGTATSNGGEKGPGLLEPYFADAADSVPRASVGDTESKAAADVDSVDEGWVVVEAPTDLSSVEEKAAMAAAVVVDGEEMPPVGATVEHSDELPTRESVELIRKGVADINEGDDTVEDPAGSAAEEAHEMAHIADDVEEIGAATAGLAETLDLVASGPIQAVEEGSAADAEVPAVPNYDSVNSQGTSDTARDTLNLETSTTSARRAEQNRNGPPASTASLVEQNSETAVPTPSPAQPLDEVPMPNASPPFASPTPCVACEEHLAEASPITAKRLAYDGPTELGSLTAPSSEPFDPPLQTEGNGHVAGTSPDPALPSDASDAAGVKELEAASSPPIATSLIPEVEPVVAASPSRTSSSPAPAPVATYWKPAVFTSAEPTVFTSSPALAATEELGDVVATSFAPVAPPSPCSPAKQQQQQQQQQRDVDASPEVAASPAPCAPPEGQEHSLAAGPAPMTPLSPAVHTDQQKQVAPVSSPVPSPAASAPANEQELRMGATPVSAGCPSPADDEALVKPIFSPQPAASPATSAPAEKQAPVPAVSSSMPSTPPPQEEQAAVSSPAPAAPATKEQEQAVTASPVPMTSPSTSAPAQEEKPVVPVSSPAPVASPATSAPTEEHAPVTLVSSPVPAVPCAPSSSAEQQELEVSVSPAPSTPPSTTASAKKEEPVVPVYSSVPRPSHSAAEQGHEPVGTTSSSVPAASPAPAVSTEEQEEHGLTSSSVPTTPISAPSASEEEQQEPVMSPYPALSPISSAAVVPQEPMVPDSPVPTLRLSPAVEEQEAAAPAFSASGAVSSTLVAPAHEQEYTAAARHAPATSPAPASPTRDHEPVAFSSPVSAASSASPTAPTCAEQAPVVDCSSVVAGSHAPAIASEDHTPKVAAPAPVSRASPALSDPADEQAHAVDGSPVPTTSHAPVEETGPEVADSPVLPAAPASSAQAPERDPIAVTVPELKPSPAAGDEIKNVPLSPTDYTDSASAPVTPIYASAASVTSPDTGRSIGDSAVRDNGRHTIATEACSTGSPANESASAKAAATKPLSVPHSADSSRSTPLTPLTKNIVGALGQLRTTPSSGASSQPSVSPGVQGARLQRLIMDESSTDSSSNPLKQEGFLRLVLCTGRVYSTLLTARKTHSLQSKIAIVCLEQPNPFPFDLVMRELRRFPNAEIVWCQEEPKNMGPFSYIEPRLRTCMRAEGRGWSQPLKYVGRPWSGEAAAGEATPEEREAMLGEALLP